MILIGNLEQLQLSTLLERIEHHQKTGKVIVISDGVQEEIYVDQGQVVAGSSPDDKEPLLRRLARSGVISLHDLQQIPTNIGQIISQSQGNKRYSDVQIAKVLLKLGVVSREQLAKWAKQESTKALKHLQSQPAGQVYFEEGVQLPADNLYLFLEAEAFLSPVMHNATPMNSNTVREAYEVPTKPLPSLFKQIKPAAEIKASTPVTPLPIFLKNSQTTTRQTLAPVAPSGFVRLSGTIGRTLAIPAVQATRAVVQRTVTAIQPYLPIDDTLTERVPTPPKPNPLFQWETLLIIAVLLVAGLAHGINMFHYPYYEDDEGTYLSQAFAVLHLGRLAYYTYWYDHAPLGWLQIAAWTLLTGGFHTFGPVVNSGRVLMLLMQVGSTFMLYCIARRISGSVTVAVIASLLFALSPYGIYFHRRVLLDNITTFWMLLSILLLVSQRLSLRHVWLSALALGISILSKELTIFLVPVLAYLVFYRADRSHRWFATIGWIALVSSIVSLYVLMAILKGELFPTGTLLGGTAPHVSLLGSLQFQASRGKDGGLLDLHSGFWQLVKVWARDDPMLVVGGGLSAIFSVFIVKTQRLMGIMGLATLSLYAFLGRGGEIIGFYLVPLLPLLALNVGLALGFAVKGLRSLLAGLPGITMARVVELVMVGLCILSLFAAYTSPDLGFDRNAFILWNGSQADAQNQATQWIEKNLPQGSRMIIDESMWTDLYDHGYTSAHYYWKAQDDPAIRDKVFHDNWRTIDYVVTTIQMLTDAQSQNMTLVEEAIAHSKLIARFDTGGWPVEIRKVDT